MQQLYYELSVLAKSVHFRNLSAAAVHVGLSQPQLSRIISKLEEELQVVLLDRAVKRKSGWTQAAFSLAEIFEKASRRLEADLVSVTQTQMHPELHIGTLEGLSDFAVQVSKKCFQEVGIKKITLDIYDLNELEANFLSGNLDLIFTSHSPGRQKFKYNLELGFQKLEYVQTSSKYLVLSTFENGRADKKLLDSAPHALISNSLALRKQWFKEIGGTGHMPTEAKRGRSKDAEPVLMIASEVLSPLLWEKLEEALA